MSVSGTTFNMLRPSCSNKIRPETYDACLGQYLGELDHFFDIRSLTQTSGRIVIKAGLARVVGDSGNDHNHARVMGKGPSANIKSIRGRGYGLSEGCFPEDRKTRGSFTSLSCNIVGWLCRVKDSCFHEIS